MLVNSGIWKEELMKIAVIYESIYGNTAQIAEAVADGLRGAGDVDVGPASDEPADVDLLVVGAPTHAHGLPTSVGRKALEKAAEDAEAKGEPLDYQPTAAVRGLLDRLPEVDGVAAACFDTRFEKSRILTGSAARTMTKKLGRKGYRVIAEPESFFVTETEGPLKDGEIERARRWGESIASLATGSESRP
jgi:hypothetical protein